MIPKPLHLVNEGLAFLLELLAFAALAWWGFETGGNLLVHLVLGIGAPAAAIVLWGLIAAPKARWQVPLPGVLLLKAAVFAGAALCLDAVGHPALAWVFAAVALVNTAVATVDRNALMHERRA
ncbi:YrdB family protein [Streptacidiphilus sp. N1-12]|uniref:YrdB family protein n=2 Tax=Streptacidiphilus alkalitolerans TaxID=3342712 RepID=A0ABV6WJM3_9ACTN